MFAEGKAVIKPAWVCNSPDIALEFDAVSGTRAASVAMVGMVHHAGFDPRPTLCGASRGTPAEVAYAALLSRARTLAHG